MVPLHVGVEHVAPLCPKFREGQVVCRPLRIVIGARDGEEADRIVGLQVFHMLFAQIVEVVADAASAVLL